MTFSFKDVVETEYDERERATAPIEAVDALEFITSSKFLDETPLPLQSLVIKILYGLWEKYPVTPREQELIDLLEEEWGIVIDLDHRDIKQRIEVLILVIGRRGTKTSLNAYIQTYEAYKLICKGDPQKYYGIRRKHPIQIMNTAKDGDQAKDPFQLVKDNIKRVDFFRPYVDPAKDNESELRLFSPADVYENKKIQAYNETRPKGAPKQNKVEGSILISGVTTSAPGKRGKAIICLTLDEYAHFDRAKTSATSEADILQEMPQTDYAMWKALTPAVKDFHGDGKILAISSPREKAGEFYKLYCAAGGREQISPDNVVPEPNYVMLQLNTWQANSHFVEENFASDYKKDPVGANMEYGAHFGDPSSAFVDPLKIEEMFCPTKHFSTMGSYHSGHIITVDPASKGDTYAVAWGHLQLGQSGTEYHIDGMYGFTPTITVVDGHIQRGRIDPSIVITFIKGVADSIKRTGGKVLEICYDQFNSVDSIFDLQASGYAAFETTFTNKYKGKMYPDFLEKMNINQIKCFSLPQVDQPTCYIVNEATKWIDTAKGEIKYLQRVVSGNTVYFGAPSSGPITTDDFADVMANLVHRLAKRAKPDRKTMLEIYKQTGVPVRISTGRTFGVGSSGFFPKAGNAKNIAAQRMRRHR